MRRRFTLIAFGLLIVCLWCAGCSSFATQNQTDFFTKDQGELLITDQVK
jgi:hypothetical protein